MNRLGRDESWSRLVITSLRSRRKHKAWGAAKRNPRDRRDEINEPVKRATAVAEL